MTNRVCAYCGQKVVGSECLRPKCKEYFQKRQEQRAKQKLPDYQKEVKLLNSYESNSFNLGQSLKSNSVSELQ